MCIWEILGLRQSEVRMKTIGLTGGTGSGKSLVSEILKKNNAFIIDADKIAHEIILKGRPAYDEILEYFGRNILDIDGNIIRKKLGEIVFSDKKKLQYLNLCTHKYICKEIEENISLIKMGAIKYSCIVIDAPLLIEGNLIPLCDEVWIVFADEERRISRIMNRDNISKEQASARIASQMSWNDYEKYADEIINNNYNIEYVNEQVNKLLNRII